MKTFTQSTLRACLLLLTYCVLFSAGLYAQTPAGINYQGVARDATGNAMANALVAIQFTIHASSAAGPVAYQETHTFTTNSLGLFDLVIGNGSASQGTFSSIAWEANSHFVQIEMDATGGSNFQNMGTSQLMSVPYAQHAKTVENDQVDDADADPANELQTLTQAGASVSLSQGGGTISVNDSDADPLNELQTISKSGTTVTLSNGGGSFTDETDDGDWVFNGTDIYAANTGNVGIGITSPTRRLTVLNNIAVERSNGNRLVEIQGSNNNTVGQVRLLGENGSLNINLNHLSSQPNLGFLGVYNDNSAQRFAASQGSGNNNSGLHWTYGDNGNLNSYSTYLTGSPNNGLFSIHDQSGINQCGLYVNTSGQGVVYGDIKNFRMDHPTQAGKEIWYASLEGPEAGAYCRGTAQLNRGTATVSFDDHFSQVANETTLTVLLTPLDGSSKGLAVVKKTANGFEVVELMGGQGSYAFDWEVKGVRKGYENYRAVRDASELQAGDLENRKAMTEPAQ